MIDHQKKKLIEKFAVPVPRYTSYPTAPHFSDNIDSIDFADNLLALRSGARLSLYMHIPFCDTLCWFCGCNTKMVKRYDPIAKYLPLLIKEIENVSCLLPFDHTVRHIHWGGGSPNILNEDDIGRLSDATRAAFQIGEDAEFAVEIDPRDLRDTQIAAFADAGVTRISVGVQDFSEKVQWAINRIQSFEETERAITKFREKGVRSINMDLIYGLPFQTKQSVADSIEKVLLISPDRIALFGYAHLPKRIKHQAMIDDDALPDIFERYEQAETLARYLINAGYVRIGLDHFAKPTDPMAASKADGILRRNFQGYTTDKADALIGLGASAISQFDGAYFQNAVPTAQYLKAIEEEGLATRRGYVLSKEDMVRRDAIEQIMCNLELSENRLKAIFGEHANPVLSEVTTLLDSDDERLLRRTDDGFKVKEKGQPFLRSICAHFDTYLAAAKAVHSTGV